MSNQLDHAKENAKADCPKCKGDGIYFYDENHATICDLCCKHDQGSWLLEEHYGMNNGKWCCLGGCGQTRDSKF